MDSIEAYVDWVILLAVVIAWAGIRRETEIEALGVKFNRRHAFFAVAALYLIANVAFLILVLRIGDLIALLDRNHTIEGITTLATHKWVLNPFSYFGKSGIARLHSGEGFGLLIATWWLCNGSLYTLMDEKKNRRATVLLVLFLGIGLTSMLAIQRVYMILLECLKSTAPNLFAEMSATSFERTVATFLGIVVGSLIFTAVNVLQYRWLNKRNTST